ncbi:MAG: hypothetical protein OXU45_09125, partial [Candidatus Melainabacteria bacterium]|nr:hypothetical protein [Candidatus Melainabacteria bacterium]
RSYQELTNWLTEQIRYLCAYGKIPQEDLVDDFFRNQAQASLDFIRQSTMSAELIPSSALQTSDSMPLLGDETKVLEFSPCDFLHGSVFESDLPRLIAAIVKRLYHLSDDQVQFETPVLNAARFSFTEETDFSHPVIKALEHLTRLILIKPWLSNCENATEDLYGIPVDPEDEVSFEQDGYVTTEELVRGDMSRKELACDLVEKTTDLVRNADPAMADFALENLRPRQLGRQAQRPYLRILSSYLDLDQRFQNFDARVDEIDDKLAELYWRSLTSGSDDDELRAGFALGSLPSLRFDEDLYDEALNMLLTCDDWSQRFVAARVLSKMDYPLDFIKESRGDATELFVVLLDELKPANLTSGKSYTGVAFYLARTLAKLLEPDKELLYAMVDQARGNQELEDYADLFLQGLSNKAKAKLADQLIPDLDDSDRDWLASRWLVQIAPKQTIEQLSRKIPEEEIYSRGAILALVNLCNKYDQAFPEALQPRLTLIQQDMAESIRAEQDPVNGRLTVPPLSMDATELWDVMADLKLAGPATSPVLIDILQNHSNADLASDAEYILGGFDYRVLGYLEQAIRGQHCEAEDYDKVTAITNLLGIIQGVLQDREQLMRNNIDTSFANGYEPGSPEFVVNSFVKEPVAREAKESCLKLLCDIYAGTKNLQLMGHIAAVIDSLDFESSQILRDIQLEGLTNPRAAAAKELLLASRFSQRLRTGLERRISAN